MKHLPELIQSLAGNNENWHNWWQEQQHQLETCSPTNLNQLYNILRNMEAAYGGMGSFNDTMLSEQSEILKNSLYTEIQNSLRNVWQNLGNEHHQYENFLLIPVGTKVQLIKGAVLYFDRLGRPEVAQFEQNHVYTVIENSERDITNMPMYYVRYESTHRVARHEALKLLA